jgi:TRAP-type C4-dicarboxylate transport system permease small subunit
MQKVVDGYFYLLRILIALCLAIMVVLVFGNVVLRYGFNLGITASEELSRLLFVWLTFLGAIVALRDHDHLGVDILVRRLPTAAKKFCLVLSHLLMLYATWLMLDGSWQQTIINLDVAAPATGVSMGLFYGVGVIFGISALAILFHNLFLVVTGKVREEDLVMVKESEELEEFEELMEHEAHAHPATAHPATATASPKK